MCTVVPGLMDHILSYLIGKFLPRSGKLNSVYFRVKLRRTHRVLTESHTAEAPLNLFKNLYLKGR